MSPSLLDYLHHVLDESDYLSAAVEGLSREGFLTDETRKRAFVRSIEIIGEAIKQVPQEWEIAIRRSNGGRLPG